MGFRANGFATVWEVKSGNGNYSDVRLSTSKKNKQTDQYETDFSGFVRFVGSAHQKATSLKEKDKIKLGDCEVTNRYDKDKKVTYTNFAVYDFEMPDSGNSGRSQNSANRNSSATSTTPDFVNVPDNLDGDDLPFN